jgi:hypothetical protein
MGTEQMKGLAAIVPRSYYTRGISGRQENLLEDGLGGGVVSDAISTKQI